MDSVILAAGKGSRLDGIMPPFHKPLLVVNGKPLIRQAVELAMRCVDGRVTVVVAPENALPICQVLDGPGMGKVDVIVQRSMLGPGVSLRTGLRHSTAGETLVLLADNVLTFADIDKIVKAQGNAVGVSMLDASEAERFTRARAVEPGDVTAGDGKVVTTRTDIEWVEKVPVIEADLFDHGMATCWVGPIKVNTTEMERAITDWMSQGRKEEVPIGPLFNRLSYITTVPVTSIDIGVPEALQ